SGRTGSSRSPALELPGERLRRLEPIRGDAVDLEQDAAVRAHGERGADRLLGRRSPERDDHDFPGASLFFAPQRLLDGELVVGIADELDARVVERLAVAGDLHA